MKPLFVRLLFSSCLATFCVILAIPTTSDASVTFNFTGGYSPFDNQGICASGTLPDIAEAIDATLPAALLTNPTLFVQVAAQ